MPSSFDKISITARLTAFMRQFSDIPFAKDVADRLNAVAAFHSLFAGEDADPKELMWYAPVFEVRYKAIAAAIGDVGASQVLELASGWSLRGLAMTRNPSIRYVETDLPGLTDEKRTLIRELRDKYQLQDLGNYFVADADALNVADLDAAAARLAPGRPTAVISEGLLQYLTQDEIARVAHNVRSILQQFGGAWITPDFAVRGDVVDRSERQRRFREMVAGATDRPLYQGAFESEQALNDFFEREGFVRRLVRQVDLVPTITSFPADDVETFRARLGGRLRLWILTLRP